MASTIGQIMAQAPVFETNIERNPVTAMKPIISLGNLKVICSVEVGATYTAF